MIQTVNEQVKIEIAIQVKNEVQREMSSFLENLENKVLKMVGSISEEEVSKAVKDHVPEQGTIEYMNFWAGVNLISFIKKENDKLRKEFKDELIKIREEMLTKTWWEDEKGRLIKGIGQEIVQLLKQK